MDNEAKIRIARLAEKLETLAKSGPLASRDLVFLGRYCQLNNRVQEAFKYFNLAIQTAPDDPECYESRAQLYFNHDKIDDAEKDLEKGLSLAPDSAGLQFIKGEILRRKLDFPGAIAAYTAALEAEPGCFKALYARGLLFLKQGDKEKGDADIEKAQAVHGKSPEAVKAWKQEK